MLSILDEEQRSIIAETALVSLLAGPLAVTMSVPSEEDCEKCFEYNIDLGEVASSQQDTPKSKPTERFQKQVRTSSLTRESSNYCLCCSSVSAEITLWMWIINLLKVAWWQDSGWKSIISVGFGFEEPSHSSKPVTFGVALRNNAPRALPIKSCFVELTDERGETWSEELQWDKKSDGWANELCVYNIWHCYHWEMFHQLQNSRMDSYCPGCQKSWEEENLFPAQRISCTRFGHVAFLTSCPGRLQKHNWEQTSSQVVHCPVSVGDWVEPNNLSIPRKLFRKLDGFR